MNLIAGCFFFEKGKQDWYSLDPTNEKKGREDINEQNDLGNITTDTKEI